MEKICGDEGTGTPRCISGVTACTGGAMAATATFVALTVLSLLFGAWVNSWFLTASVSSAALSNVVRILMWCGIFAACGTAVAIVGGSAACCSNKC